MSTDEFDVTMTAAYRTPGRRRNNFTAVVDPAVTDDIGDGYEVGSTWVNTADDTVYVCTDSTAGAAVWKRTDGTSAPGAGAPTDAGYLVTAAHGDLSAEVVVGVTPGGELGGTWASPTVDATHSGSSHADIQSAAEATAAAALAAHTGDTTDAHDASAISVLDAATNFTGTDVEAVLAELAGMSGGPHAHDAVDVTYDPTASGLTATDVQAAIDELAAAPGGGAPTTADYLVGTAQGGLSAEIVVGTTPGGELGGTWASPTVDATHSGSSHAGVQSAAEATAAAALSAHDGASDAHHVWPLTDTEIPAGIARDSEVTAAIAAHTGDTSDAHDASAISVADAGGNFTGTDVEAVLAELAAAGPGGGPDLTTLYTDTTVSGAHSADAADGATHDLTLTGDATITPGHSAPPGAGHDIDLRLLIRQDGTGGHTLAWAGTIFWIGGSAPTGSTDPDSLLTVGLLSVDDAATWLGYVADPPGIALATTVTDETDWGITPTAGVSTSVAREDHTHGSPGAPAGGGVPSGTSFPVSPATGDHYIRTDKHSLEFVYDGAQWHTTAVMAVGTGAIATTVSNTYPLGNIPSIFTAIKPISLVGGFHVTTTNDGTRYWTVELDTAPDGATPAWTTFMSFNTSAKVANQYHHYEDTTATGNVTQTKGILAVRVIKTSTAGQLDGGAALYYQGVAT
jgi:hypothetical protein